jgi:predicted RNA polymerase sigma factor
MSDAQRSTSAAQRRENEVASHAAREESAPELGVDDPEDDSLELLFLCCHPAVSSPSRVALTLRAVGGMTTAEIARAFLVPEATMAQRISRAKQRIREAGATFGLIDDRERAARLREVSHVLYLVFNEATPPAKARASAATTSPAKRFDSRECSTSASRATVKSQASSP